MNDSNPSDAKRTHTALWVKIVLGLSLALNLVIVGLVAGTLMRSNRAPGGGAIGHAIPYIIALPAQDRREVFKSIRDERDKAGFADRRERAGHYRAVLAVLEAEAVDRAQLKSVLERQAQSSAQMQKLAQGVWIELVASYSFEERMAYSVRLREVLKRGGKRRGKVRERP